MGYITKGHIDSKTTAKYTNQPSRSYVRTYSCNASCSDTSNQCLFLLKDNPIGTVENWVFYCVNRKDASLKQVNAISETFELTKYDDGRIIEKTLQNEIPPLWKGTESHSDGTIDYSFSSTIPRFNTRKDAIKYVNTGDLSDAVKDASTTWNLYIDGTKSPL